MNFSRGLTIVAITAALVHVAAAEPVERILSRDGILYVSGGVGAASQERLKMLEPQFNVKLVFTLSNGQYLADVKVVLRDTSGKLLLEHVTEGPIFMARLPAGTYQVSATYTGKAQSRAIKATPTLRTEYFRWSGGMGMEAPAHPESRVTGAPQPTMPAPTSPPFVVGGIGADSIAELKAQEGQYNLKLVFTLIEGNYIADVNVAVKGAGGKTVLEHFADGPIFMARLPAGNYTVTVKYRGNAQSREIKVGEKLRTEYFRWPANPKTDLPVSRWLEPDAGNGPTAPQAR